VTETTIGGAAPSAGDGISSTKKAQ